MEAFGLSSNQVAGWGRRCLQFSLHLKDHLLFLKEPQTWVYILTLLLIYWLGTWRRSLPSLGLSSRGHLWAQSQGPAILLTPHCNFQTVLVPPLQGPLSRDPPPPAIPLLSAVTFQLSGHFPTLPEAPSSLSPHALQAQATFGVTLRSTQKAYSTGQPRGPQTSSSPDASLLLSPLRHSHPWLTPGCPVPTSLLSLSLSGRSLHSPAQPGLRA